jgi:hypothetical protein
LKRTLISNWEKQHGMCAIPAFGLIPEALLSLDVARLPAVLHLGLATPQHAGFVARLATAKESKS